MELVLMIARDVYIVSKWTYDTVCVAQRHEEHLTHLKRRFEAQLFIIRGFANLFLQDLPANDDAPGPWLPGIRLKYEELQKLLAGGWTRLALKYDPTYQQFNENYTQVLERGPSHLLPATGHSQWLIEDATPSASTVPAPSTNVVGPLAENPNLRTPDGSKKKETRLEKLIAPFKSAKASLDGTVARYRFAAWDKRKIENTLTEMEKITSKMVQMTPFIMLTHPKFSPQRTTQEALRQALNEILASPQLRREAEMIGVTNYMGIQRVIDLGDGEGTTTEEHQRRLEAIPIPTSSREVLPCASLTPEHCAKLSAGIMKDGNGANEEVLIEYKGWAGVPDQDFVAQRRKDIESLFHVLALAQAPFYPNLLKLRGQVLQEAEYRYAFIFDYPTDSLHEQPRSLQQIIEDGASARDGSTLEKRSKMALELAKSLAALHAAGWVHESICSESVVIFRDAELQWCYDKPYLVNFEFSRPAGSATQYASAAAEHLILYQHPDRLQRDPVKYTKKHDLFSLGIVLLEIGLWKTAKMMWESRDGAQTVAQGTYTGARDVYLAIAKEELGQSMGERFQKAVISLLSATESSIEMIKEVINACPRFE